MGDVDLNGRLSGHFFGQKSIFLENLGMNCLDLDIRNNNKSWAL